jgi:hypothetical protein
MVKEKKFEWYYSGDEIRKRPAEMIFSVLRNRLIRFQYKGIKRVPGKPGRGKRDERILVNKKA